MEILIIQILRMGDALQLVPIIKEIKRVFPASRISLLTSNLGATVFQNLAEVEGVYILHKETIISLLQGDNKQDLVSAVETLESDLSALMNPKWDWVINLGYTFSSALISFLLDAKHRSGFAANKYRQYTSKDAWFPFSLASFMNRRYSTFNWVDIHKQSIGLRSVPKGPYVVPTSADMTGAASIIQRTGLREDKLIGIHPGAGGDYKQWPIENFGRLGRMLVSQYGFQILIFGTRSEAKDCDRLKTLIGEGAANLAGQTSLEELAACLLKCELLITNDTGPMHLASAVGTRVIALFFSTHFVETGPYGDGHIAIHPDIPCFPCQGTAKCQEKACLDQVSVEAVKWAIDRILSPSKKHHPETGSNPMDLTSVFRSGFDPWGNLDWQPVGSHGLTSQTIEKLLIKTAWLNYSDVLDSSDASLDDYTQTTVQAYDASATNGDMASFLSGFSDQLVEFSSLLENAKGLSFELQSEFVNGLKNRDTIRRLSERLEDTEKAISRFGQDSAFSFLSELLAALLENIEKTNRLNLSTRTAEVYRDLTFLVNIMRKQTDTVNGYTTSP